MIPVSPVVKGCEEIVYAKNQPPYLPLPAIKYKDGTVLTRWKMSWRERLRVLVSGSIFLWVKTFNQPLQPLLMDTKVERIH